MRVATPHTYNFFFLAPSLPWPAALGSPSQLVRLSVSHQRGVLQGSGPTFGVAGEEIARKIELIISTTKKIMKRIHLRL